ncbi:hypothetical protein HUU61_04100 [Rhodopseudomonas palustris]|nr:hypothetical protein [Rhodopseudomonas palustris]
MTQNPSSAWQAALVARHPNAFNVEFNGRITTPGYPSVGDGWRELVETAVGRMVEAAAPRGSLTIVQIKEKFGGLRIYWHGRNLSAVSTRAIEEAVALAEARSACTCEVCGAEGRLHKHGGWFATACPEHARGNPVRVKPGFDNIRIVRSFEPGKPPILSCRRYDRATDTFVDVDPASLGIEE